VSLALATRLGGAMRGSLKIKSYRLSLVHRCGLSLYDLYDLYDTSNLENMPNLHRKSLWLK